MPNPISDIFEESFYTGDNFKGRTGKTVRHVPDNSRRANGIKSMRPIPRHINLNALTMDSGHIAKRKTPFLVGRDGSLMASPNIFDEQSQPMSYSGAAPNVRNSPFSDYNGYPESSYNPLEFTDNEPDNLFGIFEGPQTRARKLKKRADKAASKGNLKKATRLSNKAQSKLNKVIAGQNKVAEVTQAQANLTQSAANRDAADAALQQLNENGATGQISTSMQSLLDQSGQMSPLQNAAMSTKSTSMTPYDPNANGAGGAALPSGGGGGAASLSDTDAENGGAVKTLDGVTVTSDSKKNIWLFVGIGAAVLIVLAVVFMKKKK